MPKVVNFKRTNSGRNAKIKMRHFEIFKHCAKVRLFMLEFKVGHSLVLNQRFLTFFDRWKNLCQRRGDVDEVAKLIVSVIIHSFSINGESFELIVLAVLDLVCRSSSQA